MPAAITIINRMPPRRYVGSMIGNIISYYLITMICSKEMFSELAKSKKLV
jgi:hypothetical protein